MTSRHLVSTRREDQSEYAKSIFRDNLKGLDAFSRHKKFINDYVRFYGQLNNPSSSNIGVSGKTEFDILKENHKFLRSATEEEGTLTWEQRVAKKYYDKLFKEYCIAELKLYKEGKVALRWRIEKEVISGKGQLICGSTRCSETTNLKSWEVNFAYIEDSEKKNALVKIRLCPRCSEKLNYRNKYKEAAIKREEGVETPETAQHSSSYEKKRHDRKHVNRKRKHEGIKEEYSQESGSSYSQNSESDGESATKNRKSGRKIRKTTLEIKHEAEGEREKAVQSSSTSRDTRRDDEERRGPSREPISPQVRIKVEEHYDEFFKGLFD